MRARSRNERTFFQTNYNIMKKGMIKGMVLYSNGDGKRFELEYYCSETALIAIKTASTHKWFSVFPISWVSSMRAIVCNKGSEKRSIIAGSISWQLSYFLCAVCGISLNHRIPYFYRYSPLPASANHACGFQLLQFLWWHRMLQSVTPVIQVQQWALFSFEHDLMILYQSMFKSI